MGGPATTRGRSRTPAPGKAAAPVPPPVNPLFEPLSAHSWLEVFWQRDGGKGEARELVVDVEFLGDVIEAAHEKGWGKGLDTADVAFNDGFSKGKAKGWGKGRAVDPGLVRLTATAAAAAAAAAAATAAAEASANAAAAEGGYVTPR